MINLLGHLPVRRKVKGETGAQGIPGVIHRTSEWAAGVEYRNDSLLTSDMRYVDIAVVTTGVNTYSVYRCKKTHTSSSSITVANTTYWEEMNTMYPIYTPLIMADNAVFRFAQTNQLYVMKDDGVTVNLAMGGGDYPLWIGAPTADDASFKVNFDGKLYATDAEISGTVNADAGRFGIFFLGEGSYGEGLFKAEIYDESFGDTYRIKIQPNLFEMYGKSSAGSQEFIMIMPNINSDKYDSEGLVWISGSEGKAAISISYGMALGLRPYMKVVSASQSIHQDVTVVRGASSKVTLSIPDSYLVRGALFKIINAGSYAIRIQLSQDQSIIDKITGVTGYPYYLEVSADVGVFYVTYDGTYTIIYD